MNLAQASAGNINGRGARLLTLAMQLFPFLEFADFRRDTSTYVTDPSLDSYSGSAARAVNAALQKDAQAPNPTSASLKLYGREMSYDDLYKMDARVTGAPALFQAFAERRLAGLMRQLGLEVVIDMLSGTLTNYKMLGFSEFVKDAAAGGQTARLGYSAAQLAAMNVQAGIRLDMSKEEDLRAFDELLRKQLATVPGANAIICNTSLHARLGSIAKKLGSAGESTSTFGTVIPSYDGRPLIAVPDTAITMVETDGVNADCTSLYVVRFAEQQGVTFSTNSGFLFTDFPEDVVKPDSIARLQFFLNLTVETTDAFKRISRIRL